MHFCNNCSLPVAVCAVTMLWGCCIAKSNNDGKTAEAPVKVIFDCDMYTDFDDVGALATLHALADAGECEILGTLVCTRGAPSLGMVEILNSYYGRSGLPVGQNR